MSELKEKITDAISQIREGKSSPKNLGVGKMFNELMTIDHQGYLQLMEEYKPVADEYFKNNPDAKMSQEQANKKKLAIKLENEMMDSIINDLNNSDDMDIDLSDDQPTSRRGPSTSKPKSINRDRIAKVRVLAPKVVKPKGERDRSAYKFNGEEYGKGPLVRAVIFAHVTANPGITHDQLKKCFPDALLRSYGIFKKLDEAQEISKVRKRYFLKDEQLVELSDYKVAICNQFISDNIVGFLDAAKKLGYVIE